MVWVFHDSFTWAIHSAHMVVNPVVLAQVISMLFNLLRRYYRSINGRL